MSFDGVDKIRLEVRRGLDGDGQGYWKIVCRCPEIKRNKKRLLAKSQECGISDKLHED